MVRRGGQGEAEEGEGGGNGKSDGKTGHGCGHLLIITPQGPVKHFLTLY